ncbi:hypothetical protein DY000_02035249, partial [Brassica cretica]
EELDRFSLVADELSLISNNLRAMVVTEVPKLASAAEYFFKKGVEGKQFRPTILLLMGTALNVRLPEALAAESADSICLAKNYFLLTIFQYFHSFSISVLAGDFLLSRACVALAALKNTEVACLLATVVEHFVTGETMQMTSRNDQRHKRHYKTASLISNSCKSIALLARQSAEVAMLAFEYGKNLLRYLSSSEKYIRHGIVTAPILFAMEEFPQLRKVVDQLDKDPTNVDILGKSNGIRRPRELAMEHANLAAAAIGSLPETDDEDVKRSRRALVDLTHRVITRNK